ncbi:MAG: trehalose-6-phosphate synthase, partial [Firmicutes bacterium]|nr:trehalose-6-phosphate synthase [Bacillota bacterium]
MEALPRYGWTRLPIREPHLPQRDPSYEISLVDIPEDIYEPYYNRISNPLIWFVFHYLWNLVDHPMLDRSIIEDWKSGYLEANRLLAEAAVEEALLADKPLIMLQDYHLFAAAKFVKEALPDVPVMHFNHIPWPEPGYFRVLPEEIRSGLLEGLLAADVLGFQIPEYAEAFLACCEAELDCEIDFRRSVVRNGNREVLARAYPISIDPNALIESLNDAEVAGQANGVAQSGIGDEVGGGDPQPLAGAKDGGKVDLANPLEGLIRPGLDDLQGVLPGRPRRRIVRRPLHMLAGGEVPVL